jgi:phenylalanine-4-hydroxylase
MSSLPNPPTRQTVQLRGDYLRARADFTLEQDYSAYTPTDQATWRKLFLRQQALLPAYAADHYRTGLRLLACQADVIPRLGDLSTTLERICGWQVVGVPGLLPERDFFQFLAERRFPVTTWMRKPEELDYLVEPDFFHDCFGHLPLLTDPEFGNFVQAYGARGVAASDAVELQRLARLYWYTVEFGLMKTAAGLRVYGAGIISSFAETLWAIDSNKPQRLPFDAATVMATPYLIDEFQSRYFVIESFEQLIEAVLGTES